MHPLFQKVSNFFIETPAAEEFELKKDECAIDIERGVYSFAIERFDYQVAEKPISGSFAISEINENGEEEWHCFIPVEEGFLPAIPFALGFKKVLEVEYGTLDNIFVIVAENNAPNCFKGRAPEDVFLIQISAEKKILESVKVSDPNLYTAVSQVVFAGGNKHFVIPKSLEEQVKEKIEEISSSMGNPQIPSYQVVENPLLHIIEYGKSEVKIPKKLKLKNIATALFIAAIAFAGYKGYQKYQQYKLEQEMAKKKEWVPTPTFKRQHIGYYFDNEREKFKEVAKLFKTSVVKIKSLNFDKRGYVVQYISPIPLYEYRRQGNLYTKTIQQNFRMFTGWKPLRYSPPKPLESFKKVYQKFKEKFGKTFTAISYNTRNVEGVNLKCIEVRKHEVLPLLDAKKLLETLSEYPVEIENGKISKVETKLGGEKYNLDLRFFLCGDDR
jgi:hypothetical protein